MAVDRIPPEGLDLELRRVVNLLNLIDGVGTHSSCWGHDTANQTAEIEFSVRDLETLRRLLSALPFLGVRGRLMEGPVLESIHVVATVKDDQVAFRLLISAMPPAARLALVREVEGAIAGVLAGPARRYPCSRPG